MTEETPPPSPGRTRTRGRALRLVLAGLGVLILVIIGGLGALAVLFDPNDFKPRIVQAVREATGRDLTLNGHIGIKLSLVPTIEVRDVAIANPPGFSRPQMATLKGLELQLRLLGLLSSRIEVKRLTLDSPDILLETDAKGAANWVFTPDRPAPTAAAASTPGGGAGSKLFLHVAEIAIKDGRATYRDGQTGNVNAIALTRLSIDTPSPDAPIRIDGDIRIDDLPLTIKAEAGSQQRLQDEASRTPFPVNLTLTSGSATIKLDGTLTQPRQGKGYATNLSLNLPDTAILSAFVPRIPRVRDIVLAARVTDTGQALPEITNLTLKTGTADLTAHVAGLRVEAFDLSAPAPTQPIRLNVRGSLDNAPLSATATVGNVVPLLTGESQPATFPLDVSATAAGATVTAKGSIAHPQALSGIALDLSARIPDLAALSPLARQPLPALKSVAIQARLADTGDGIAKGGTLRGLRLTTPDGDVAGDITLALGQVPTVTATLTATRLDVDALLAAMPKAAAKPAAAAPTGPPPQAPSERSDRLIPADPIPFDQLRQANADISAKVGTLRLKGADYKAIDAHLMLTDGHLRIDPMRAETPDGRITASFTAIAAATPSVGVVLRSPGLAVKPLLEASGAQPIASGQLEVYADLRGSGPSPRAIAATLQGSVGLAMASGTLDTRLLGGALGNIGKDVPILDIIGRGGDTGAIRCVAIRFDAQGGIAQARTLLLSTNLVTADGGGSINLRDETLNLLVRPQGRVGGTGLRIPLKISGPLRSPSAAVDATGAAEANADKLVGVVIGGATPLGAIGGLLGADKLTGADSNLCPAALALARGSTPPPETTAAPAQPQAQAPAQPQQARPAQPQNRLPDPGQMLRRLFR